MVRLKQGVKKLESALFIEDGLHLGAPYFNL